MNQPLKPFKSYYYLHGKLTAEQVEADSSLRFFYTHWLGKFLRKIIRLHWWSWLVSIYQDSFLTKKAIDPFIKKHAIALDDFIIPPKGYRSFNDFFCRKLKAGSRAIDTNPLTLTSPADAKILVFPRITPSMRFFVKTLSFDLTTFLGDANLAQEYTDGSMMIFRLAPYDYHRYHFPADGFMHKEKKINGIYESVNPIVYASGTQPLTQNKRSIITIDSPIFNQLLLIPVGAMCVGTIINTYTANTQLNKGDEAGYFAFGGSTVVLLAKKGMISINQTFIEHSAKGFETAVLMGEVVATKL